MSNHEELVAQTEPLHRECVDPLQAILSDPESHLSDVLYVYFRIYKKRLLWSFMQIALRQLSPGNSEILYLADVGASSGFDLLYLSNRLTGNFKKPLPFKSLECSLIEGDGAAIERGKDSLTAALRTSDVSFQYFYQPLVEGIPLPDASQHVVLCSEVVEHLEQPDRLLEEIYRILKPGGFLIFTTDNSPSLLQYVRRIPVLLSGRYHQVYARPLKENTIESVMRWHDKEYPIYGHINLNHTRFWERMCKQCGFSLYSYGTYESIRRGAGNNSPFVLSVYFSFAALVYHLMPRWLGRFFGDTTALLLRK